MGRTSDPGGRIVMANAKQYFINELSRVYIGIIQVIKLFSTVIGDMGVLRRQMKIKARHQILHHAQPKFVRV
jgi:hypothetical protein